MFCFISSTHFVYLILFYVPCVYTHARWELPLATQVFVVVLVLCILRPPRSQLLAPGVFKPSCSTPFTPFLHLVSTSPFTYISFPKLSPRYLCFQFPSCSWFLPNQSFSCICLHHNSSLCSTSCSLRSPSNPACLPCAAWRMGSWENGILVAEVPRGVQHTSLAWTSRRRMVGLAWPNQSAGCALL